MNLESCKILKRKTIGNNEIVLYASSKTMWILILYFNNNIIRSKNYMFGKISSVSKKTRMQANRDFKIWLLERWNLDSDIEESQ